MAVLHGQLLARCTLPGPTGSALQAASPSALRVADALRVAEGHGHVGHSSTPVQPLALGGAGPQPAAAASDAHRMAPSQDM